jgi:hypothetical protein
MASRRTSAEWLDSESEVGEMAMDVVSVGPCLIKSNEVVTMLLLSTLIGGVWREDSTVGITCAYDLCSIRERNRQVVR